MMADNCASAYNTPVVRRRAWTQLTNAESAYGGPGDNAVRTAEWNAFRAEYLAAVNAGLLDGYAKNDVEKGECAPVATVAAGNASRLGSAVEVLTQAAATMPNDACNGGVVGGPADLNALMTRLNAAGAAGDDQHIIDTRLNADGQKAQLRAFLIDLAANPGHALGTPGGQTLAANIEAANGCGAGSRGEYSWAALWGAIGLLRLGESGNIGEATAANGDGAGHKIEDMRAVATGLSVVNK
jgi:hypothetical protein